MQVGFKANLHQRLGFARGFMPALAGAEGWGYLQLWILSCKKAEKTISEFRGHLSPPGSLDFLCRGTGGPTWKSWCNGNSCVWGRPLGRATPSPCPPRLAHESSCFTTPPPPGSAREGSMFLAADLQMKENAGRARGFDHRGNARLLWRGSVT